MKQVKVTVSSRNETGRGPVRRLRKSGFIPGVVYGKSGNQSISIEEKEFRTLMRSVTGVVALIQVEGLEKPVLSKMQAFQRDSVTDKFQHVDFQEISEDEPMVVELPVHIIGEAAGVKNEGGLFEQRYHQVSVKCLPKHLPECVEVDVTELKVGESIHIKELPQLEGVTFLAEGNIVVAACSAAKMASSTEDAEAPAEEAAAEAK